MRVTCGASPRAPGMSRRALLHLAVLPLVLPAQSLSLPSAGSSLALLNTLPDYLPSLHAALASSSYDVFRATLRTPPFSSLRVSLLAVSSVDASLKPLASATLSALDAVDGLALRLSRGRSTASPEPQFAAFSAALTRLLAAANGSALLSSSQ